MSFLGRDWNYAKAMTKMSEARSWERLGENGGQLAGCLHVLKVDLAASLLFPNVVIVNVYVFRFLSLIWIFRQLNCALIITQNSDGATMTLL